MAEILNFDKFTFRCSSLGKLMTQSREKSNRALYDEAVEKKRKIFEKYEGMIETQKKKRDGFKSKEAKGYQDATDKIEELEGKQFEETASFNQEIERLEPIKNELNLSDTCISELVAIYIQAKTERRRDITNRYIKKGNQAESASIRLLSERDDEFYTKNIERRNNGTIEGECDINIDGVKTVDTKSSWDIWTFQPKTVKTVDSDYWWQGQGYMILWKVPLHELAYCLSDTPQGLIEDEKKRLLYAMGSHNKDSNTYSDGCEEIERNMKFDDIPIQERVIVIPFDFDPTAETRINEMVPLWRKWLNNYAQEEHARCYLNDSRIEMDLSKFVKESEVKLQVISVAVNVNSEELKEKVAEVLTEVINNSASGSEEQQEAEVSVLRKWYLDTTKNKTVLLSQKEFDKYPPIYLEHLGESETGTEEEGFELLKAKKMPVLIPQEPAPSWAENVKTESGLELDFNATEEQMLAKVEECNTEQECIELYNKHKVEYTQFPKFKESLRNKRDSFRSAPVAPVLVAAAPKAKPIPQISPEPKNSEQEKIDEIKALTDKCENDDQVKSLYSENALFVDLYPELIRYMTEKRKQLQAKNLPNASSL